MTRTRSRKKQSKAIPLIVGILVAALAVCGGFAVYMSSSGKAISPGSATVVNVTIPTGTGTAGIARILEENGLIGSTSSFKLHSKMKGYDGKYKAGEYALSPGMSMEEMMETIAAGNTNTIRFTIPEGYTVAQTRDKLAAEGLVNPEVFDQEVESGVFDYDFLKDAPAAANRLEGYLYPETYDVYSSATEHDIIDRMLSHFDKVVTQEYRDQAKAKGMNLNEVLTVASLVERETRADSERPLVASVIYNRLDQGMKLKIDATVQYALGKQKARLYNKDLKIDSPYNTYKIDGLPPGPICSPGIKSIEAALSPADTDYLFYVGSPELDGTHRFSNNDTQFAKDAAAYHKAADAAGL